MEIVEDTLEVDLATFLRRPRFCFLGTVDDGAPRVTPLWFHWDDGAAWMIADRRKTYPERVERNPDVDLAVVDFDRTTGTVRHVGMRGQATVEPHDPARAVVLLANYLGPDRAGWDESFFGDPDEWGEEMVMLRVKPATVVAREQSYVPAPGLGDE